MNEQTIAASIAATPPPRHPDHFSNGLYAVDHIIPHSIKPDDSTDNLAWAYPACNSCKSDKVEGTDPESGITTRLFNPRYQNWRDHFDWSADGHQIFGLSDIGRTTVAVLELNRPESVNVRSLLIRAGLHPPND